MRRAALATVLGAAGTLAATVPAYAQDPIPQPAPTPSPTPAPAPAPKAGRMQLQVSSPVALHGRPYVLTGSTVTVLGTVKTYVPGQRVRVRISTAHRKPTIVRTRIASGGTFKVRFRTRRAVTYKVFA